MTKKKEGFIRNDARAELRGGDARGGRSKLG